MAFRRSTVRSRSAPPIFSTTYADPKGSAFCWRPNFRPHRRCFGAERATFKILLLVLPRAATFGVSTTRKERIREHRRNRKGAFVRSGRGGPDSRTARTAIEPERSLPASKEGHDRLCATRSANLPEGRALAPVPRRSRAEAKGALATSARLIDQWQQSLTSECTSVFSDIERRVS